MSQYLPSTNLIPTLLTDADLTRSERATMFAEASSANARSSLSARHGSRPRRP